MVVITELDEKITFKTQLEEDVGAVILINKFHMNPEDMDQFIKTWTSAAGIAKKLPRVTAASSFFSYQYRLVA
jgi:hypothetical protein